MTSSMTALFPALVECFVIILFGYLAGRLNMISSTQSAGIGSYIKNFALPAMLFKNMVELNFSTVSWAFVVAVFLGKAIVFFIVLSLSLILVRPRSYARGALYSIFSTQSNDFALGYPLVAALYKTTHPEFVQYIYLLAPISLIILNPIGFILLEVDRHFTMVKDLEGESKQDSSESDDSSTSQPIPVPMTHNKFRSFLAVIKGVLLNPIVFMVFFGLVFHFIFKGKLPVLLDPFMTTLSKSFSATALFYLGSSMVGKINNQKGIGLVIPASLIVAKIILSPIIIRELVFSLENIWPGNLSHNSTNSSYITSLADFGYLYGTFPTAPTVVIYASQYGMEMDRLATGMVFCTSFSAPIMYVSAWTLTMTSMSSDYFSGVVAEVNLDVSIFSMFCASWVIGIFIFGRKIKRVPHFITFVLTLNIFLAALSTVLWTSLISDNSSLYSKGILFGLMFYGMISSRLMTASLAIGLLLSIKRDQRYVANQWGFYIVLPNIIAAIATVIVVACGKNEHNPSLPTFMYGKVEEAMSFGIILIAFIITGICLILISRSSSHQDTATIDEDEDYVSESSALLSHTHCHGDLQKIRHSVLLCLLLLSMLVAMSVVGWRLVGMKSNGVFYELRFLDAVLSFGQAFIVFCVFGLDSELIVDPFVRTCRKYFAGTDEISLPLLENVDSLSLRRCWQFTKYHLEPCKADIEQDIRQRLILYEKVFCGKDLCNWLVEHGLVNDISESVGYGTSLMEGRVIHHVNKKHYFYNKPYLYKFTEKKVYIKTTDNFHQPTTHSPVKQLSSPYRNILVTSPKKFYGYSFEAYFSGGDCRSYQSTPVRRSGINSQNKSKMKRKVKPRRRKPSNHDSIVEFSNTDDDNEGYY